MKCRIQVATSMPFGCYRLFLVDLRLIHVLPIAPPFADDGKDAVSYPAQILRCSCRVHLRAPVAEEFILLPRGKVIWLSIHPSSKIDADSIDDLYSRSKRKCPLDINGGVVPRISRYGMVWWTPYTSTVLAEQALRVTKSTFDAVLWCKRLRPGVYCSVQSAFHRIQA